MMYTYGTLTGTYFRWYMLCTYAMHQYTLDKFGRRVVNLNPVHVTGLSVWHHPGNPPSHGLIVIVDSARAYMTSKTQKLLFTTDPPNYVT